MFQLFGHGLAPAGSAIMVLSMLSAALSGAFLARFVIALPLHKGLILSALALVVYYGLYALGMQVLWT